MLWKREANAPRTFAGGCSLKRSADPMISEDTVTNAVCGKRNVHTERDAHHPDALDLYHLRLLT